MFYLFGNVTERHNFLNSTIGPVELEIEAINTVEIMVNYSACAVLLLIPLQIALFWAYNKIGHPWKRFLSEDDKEEDVCRRTIESHENGMLTYDIMYDYITYGETTNCISYKAQNDTITEVTPSPSTDNDRQQEFEPKSVKLEINIEPVGNTNNAPDCNIASEEMIDQTEPAQNIQKSSLHSH